jgi:hypothetical protein
MKAEYPKRTFLSSFVSGLSCIIVTLIICATIILIYGIHMTGKKTQEFVTLMQNTIHSLPAIQESLPPVVSDILNNKREIEYRDQIEISAKPIVNQQNGRLGASVTILNKGPKVVSLMSLRIVVLNNKDEVLSEINQWVVTPVAGKNNWPGLLMPNSQRYLSSFGQSPSYTTNLNDLKTRVEITEIRTWDKEASAPKESNEQKTDKISASM